jgi:hypothetical protein
MNHFETALVLVPQGQGRTWVLDAPLVYHSDRYGTIEVPTGFECDLNSIPRLGWSIAPKTDYPQAGVVHDWLYRGKLRPRGECDAIYREILVETGCPRWRAWGRWLALRAFGWNAY